MIQDVPRRGSMGVYWTYRHLLHFVQIGFPSVRVETPRTVPQVQGSHMIFVLFFKAFDSVW